MEHPPLGEEDRASGGGGGELVTLLEYYRINGPLTNNPSSRVINVLPNATPRLATPIASLRSALPPKGAAYITPPSPQEKAVSAKLALEAAPGAVGRVALGPLLLMSCYALLMQRLPRLLVLDTLLLGAFYDLALYRHMLPVMGTRAARLFESCLYAGLYAPQQIVLPRIDERDRFALVPRTTCAPDTMDIRIRIMRDIVAHDMRDTLDIEAAGRDVGRT